MGDDLDELANAADASPRMAHRRARRVPRYWFLQSLGLSVMIAGALVCLLGVAVIVVAAVYVHQSPDMPWAGWGGGVLGLLITSYGLWVLALGEAVRGFRHLIINSWHARRD